MDGFDAPPPVVEIVAGSSDSSDSSDAKTVVPSQRSSSSGETVVPGKRRDSMELEDPLAGQSGPENEPSTEHVEDPEGKNPEGLPTLKSVEHKQRFNLD